MKLDLGSGYGGNEAEQRAWEGIREVQERLVALAVQLRRNYPGELNPVLARIGEVWHQAVIIEEQLDAIERLAGFDGVIGHHSVRHFWKKSDAASMLEPDGTFFRKVAVAVAE